MLTYIALLIAFTSDVSNKKSFQKLNVIYNNKILYYVLYKSTLLCNILYNLTILDIRKIIHYLVVLKLYFIVKWLPKVLQIYLHSSINEHNYNNISEHLFQKLSEKTDWNNKGSNKGHLLRKF